MVTKTLYTCQFCNTDYADKEKAMECEKNHKIKPKIKKSVFQPYEQDRSGYPMRINIEFENGEVITYKRGSLKSIPEGCPTKVKVKFKGSDKWIEYKR